MDEMIGRLRIAFQEYNPSNSVTPQRTGFNYTQPTGLVEWMPMHQVGEQVFMKVVGYHPENPVRHGSPTIVSTISSYDTATGHLASLIDGTFATALRTGAASAVASELLALPQSSVLGLVGCGAQSITQLHAIGRIFELERILVYDVDEETASSFGVRAASFGSHVTIQSASLREIAEASDILCTATSVDVGQGPVIRLESTKPHLHVNAVGSDFPGKTELALEFLNRSVICPDFLEQAVVEGECQCLDPGAIGPAIAEIAKAPASFAKYQSQLSVFDSTGWALEDWVASVLILEHALELGLGESVSVEYLPTDPRNPYDFLIPSRVPASH